MTMFEPQNYPFSPTRIVDKMTERIADRLAISAVNVHKIACERRYLVT